MGAENLPRRRISRALTACQVRIQAGRTLNSRADRPLRQPQPPEHNEPPLVPFRLVMSPGSDPPAAGVLTSLLDVIDDAVVTTDLEGRIQSWNKSAERLYGYRAEEVIGQPLSTLLPDAVPDATYPGIHAGQHHRFETVRRSRDGQLLAVARTLAPIRDGAGAVVGVLSISRDIDGQQRSDAALTASEARWRAVVDSAVDGIVTINAHGRIEGFNRAAERLFGYTESEVSGLNVSVLMPSPYREEHDEYLARYLREGGARIIGVGREVTGQRKDGTTFPVHLSVGEMAVGGERKFTGILHDLTSRVTMEGQIREQASLARLGEMAAVIAHEVKNPLAGIRGAIQVIGTRLPADGAEAGITREIVARIDALSELMKDLLLFARPPQPHPTSVEIPALVTATAQLLRADPALKDVLVSVEGTAPVVQADPGLLKIVFVNLLVNSAQAMKGQGAVSVRVSTADGMCIVTFSDSGPGIPLEVRERVFKPFFTTKARGTGLGLATARRLVEAHRGTISVSCPAEGGTVVTVQLPFES